MAIAREAVLIATALAGQPAGDGSLRAVLEDPVPVRERPAGRTLGRLARRTGFGSRRVLGVVERRGRWLGVLTELRRDRRVGWIRADRGVRLSRTQVSLRADLSRRRLDVRIGRRTVRRLRVAVGAPGSPTPTGRFAITDKLPGARYGDYYGCCILALSGRQPDPPRGWKGGDRLAIHGTDAPGDLGAATSAGCLRASDRELRLLMRRVPLGAIVTIRR